MPRKPKVKKFTRELSVLITEKEYKHLKTFKGGMGKGIRALIDGDIQTAPGREASK